MKRIIKFYLSIKIFFRGPLFERGQIVMSNGMLTRINAVGYDFGNGSWHYRVAGQAFRVFNDAEVIQMNHERVQSLYRRRL